MRTGLYKRDKTTEIYFDEASPMVEIRTYNTDLKKRLTAYAGRFCKLTDEDEETGRKSFVIAKRCFSVRLTTPYSEERRRAASEAAKRQSLNCKYVVWLSNILMNYLEKSYQIAYN